MIIESVYFIITDIYHFVDDHVQIKISMFISNNSNVKDFFVFLNCPCKRLLIDNDEPFWQNICERRILCGDRKET